MEWLYLMYSAQCKVNFFTSHSNESIGKEHLGQASNLDILKKTQGGKNSKLKKKKSITQTKNSRFWQILTTD